MTELAFPPRVCCSFVGHGRDFEGETGGCSGGIPRNSDQKVSNSEAYSGQPAQQPALRYPASHDDDDELLVRASAVLKSQGQKTGPVGDPVRKRFGTLPLHR